MVKCGREGGEEPAELDKLQKKNSVTWSTDKHGNTGA